MNISTIVIAIEVVMIASIVNSSRKLDRFI